MRGFTPTRKPLASSHCCILHLGIPAPGAGMLHGSSCMLAVTAAPWPAGCGRSPHPGAKRTLDFGFAAGSQQPYGNMRGTATSTQLGACKDKARFVWDKSSGVSSLPCSSTLPPPPRKTLLGAQPAAAAALCLQKKSHQKSFNGSRIRLSLPGGHADLTSICKNELTTLC